jgi:8-oxo-dGTP diphosphatase
MTDGATDTPDTPHVYIGAYALCEKEGAMLLARIGPNRYDTGRWALPGGGLNWGEAPVDAVVRELTEETGLTGRAPQLAGIFSATYPRVPELPFNSVHYLGILYFVETLPGALRFEQAGSTDLCAWIPFSDLARIELVPVAEYGAVLLRHGPAAADELRDLHGTLP